MGRLAQLRAFFDPAQGVLAAMAAAYFLVLLLPSLSPHYGFYSDELYYLVCADRLAFGYVDHPPFFVWVLRLHREIFGDSLFALRMLPAAAGALTAFLTGWMARRMGGGLFAQVLATLALAVGQSLAMFSWFSVNCLGILLWAAASWVLLELCRSREPRLWLALGVVLGFAFLTKHTILVWIAGLGAATLLSGLRRDLRTRWPWLGALAFALISSPNIAWQVMNDWPSLEFYRSRADDSLPLSPLGVVVQQIMVQNPPTFPVWAAGIFFFLRSPRGSRFRPLGWLALAVLTLAMIGGQSIPYRIAGIFPVAFAGGAVLLEAVRKPDAGRLRRVWNTYTLPALLFLSGAAAATLTLPILPPDRLVHHPLYGGVQWRREPGPKRLPYLLGNRTHWQALVAEVTEVYEELDPTQRAGAIILADYFGHAGALEYYGRDLPPVYSPHTGYYLWGPPDGTPDPVISIGIDEALLREHFERVDVTAVFRCPYCPPWQDELPIRVASAPKRPFSELWKELGRIGGMDRHRRLLRAEAAE